MDIMSDSREGHPEHLAERSNARGDGRIRGRRSRHRVRGG